MESNDKCRRGFARKLEYLLLVFILAIPIAISAIILRAAIATVFTNPSGYIILKSS
jgi:hypothetical protein